MERAVALTDCRGYFRPRLIRSGEAARQKQEVAESLDIEQRNIIEEILCDLLIEAVVREDAWDMYGGQDGQDQAKAS